MGELEQQTARLTLTLRGRAAAGEAFPLPKGLAGQILAKEFRIFNLDQAALQNSLQSVLCVLISPPLELEAND